MSATAASSASASAPRVTVVGCGVVGLTTALLLQKYGAHVTIRCKTSPRSAHTDPHYTSDKAGAHWFSFASDAETRKQALDELSFYALLGLAVTEPDSGVTLIRGHALYEASAASPSTKPSIPWFAQIVPRFREWGAEELAERARIGGVEYARAFSYETVMLHAPHYLKFLLRQFLAAGGVLREGETLASLADAWQTPATPGAPAPDVVINCCGLGNATLGAVSDGKMSPDRGQVIRVRANITDIWRVPADVPTYVLPRGDGTVILGGTHQYGDGSLKPDPAVAAAILERCARVVPLLRDPANYTVLDHSVGLRPTHTSNNQRIEVDEALTAAAGAACASSRAGRPAPLVVHAYGHGGDGFQSSWGTALVVAHLIHRARPGSFQPDSLYHLRGSSQVRTGLLERALSKDLFAKL